MNSEKQGKTGRGACWFAVCILSKTYGKFLAKANTSDLVSAVRHLRGCRNSAYVLRITTAGTKVVVSKAQGVRRLQAGLFGRDLGARPDHRDTAMAEADYFTNEVEGGSI